MRLNRSIMTMSRPGSPGGTLDGAEGFDDVYRDAFPSVFAACCLVARDRDSAHDATQEAFATALERWDELSGQPWAVAWIAKVAINRARRAWRLPTPRAMIGTAVPSAGRDVGASDDAVDLRRAVVRLPSRQRQAILLIYVLDFSVESAASAMGCAGGTVKAHLSRARESLRRYLHTDEQRIGG